MTLEAFEFLRKTSHVLSLTHNKNEHTKRVLIFNIVRQAGFEPA